MTRWLKLIPVVLVVVLLTAAIGSITANAQGNNPQDKNALGVRAVFLNALIDATMKATKLDRQAIRTQLGQGKTLAEVITANGGTVDAVKADAKTTLTDRAKKALADGQLTQAQADKLLAAADAAFDKVLNYKFPTHEDRLTTRLRALGYTILLRETADATKLKARDILNNLHNDKTLAEIAKAHDADPDKIVAAAVTKAQQRIDQMVKNNRLTVDEAKQFSDNLKSEFTKMMNEKGVLPGSGRHSGLGRLFGGKNKPGAPEATPEATPNL